MGVAAAGVLRRLALLAAGGLAALAWRRRADAGAEGALPPARYEAQDVRFGPMLMAGLGMLGTVAAILGLAAWLFPDSRGAQPTLGPPPAFPAPPLQTDPAADMAAFRRRQLAQLNGAYWIDRAAGRVHLPIAQAMRDVARRGIPDWPAP